MESLGKHPNQNSEYKNTGQIIFGGYGPTAQHSYFQLMHQGTQNISADKNICANILCSMMRPLKIIMLYISDIVPNYKFTCTIVCRDRRCILYKKEPSKLQSIILTKYEYHIL